MQQFAFHLSSMILVKFAEEAILYVEHANDTALKNLSYSQVRHVETYCMVVYIKNRIENYMERKVLPDRFESIRAMYLE